MIVTNKELEQRLNIIVNQAYCTFTVKQIGNYIVVQGYNKLQYERDNLFVIKPYKAELKCFMKRINQEAKTLEICLNVFSINSVTETISKQLAILKIVYDFAQDKFRVAEKSITTD